MMQYHLSWKPICSVDIYNKISIPDPICIPAKKVHGANMGPNEPCYQGPFVFVG